MIAQQPAVPFADWLAERVWQFAERPAVEIGGVARTYRELGVASDRLALGLSEVGVRAGSRVAVMLGNSAEHIDTWFALSKLGAIEIPINTAYTGELLRYLLEQCQAEALVCDAAHLGCRAHRGELPQLKTIVLAGSADGGENGRRTRPGCSVFPSCTWSRCCLRRPSICN